MCETAIIEEKEELPRARLRREFDKKYRAWVAEARENGFNYWCVYYLYDANGNYHGIWRAADGPVPEPYKIKALPYSSLREGSHQRTHHPSRYITHPIHSNY